MDANWAKEKDDFEKERLKKVAKKHGRLGQDKRRHIKFKLCFLYFQVDTFGSIYKKLTGRDVTFEFPESYL